MIVSFFESQNFLAAMCELNMYGYIQLCFSQIGQTCLEKVVIASRINGFLEHPRAIYLFAFARYERLVSCNVELFKNTKNNFCICSYWHTLDPPHSNNTVAFDSGICKVLMSFKAYNRSRTQI